MSTGATAARRELAVVSWHCEECGRRFARTKQSHECAPAMTVEDYFSTGPAHERPVFDAVMSFLETLGSIYVEPVSVGIFLKKEGSFMQLRPMTKWVAVSFSLDHAARHPLIKRKPMPYSGRYHHVANVASPDQIDDALLDLIAESYHQAP